MKLNKIIGIFVIFVFCLISVNAVDLTTDNILYYSFDEDNVSGTTMIDLSGNSNNGTCTNMGSGCNTVPGLLINASDFDGSNEWITTNSPFGEYSGDFTVNQWVYIDTQQRSAFSEIANSGGGGNPYSFRYDETGTGKLRIIIRNDADSGNIYDYTTTNALSTSQWLMVTLSYSNTEGTKFYINGSLENSDVTTGTPNFDSGQVLALMRQVGQNRYVDGKTDEFALWNEVLNATEITKLYNNNNGFNPYDIEEPIINIKNLTINNQNYTNHIYLNTSNITLESELENISTNSNINHSLLLYYANNDTVIYNDTYTTNSLNGSITFNNLEDGLYVTNFTFANNETNTSDLGKHFHIDTTPVKIDFLNKKEFNTYKISLNDLNISINDSNYANATIDWDDGTSNFTTTKNFSGYTKTFETNGNHTFNITATDNANNHLTVSGQLFINPYQYFSFETPTGNPIENFTFNNEFFTTQAKFKIFDLVSENDLPKNVTLLFEKSGYESTNITIELNSTSNYNQTNTITLAKIVVKIYDRQTSDLLTGDTTLTLIDGTGDTATTSTGLYNFTKESFTESEYHIIAEHDGYSTEVSYFDFNNQEIVNIDIYMLNNTVSNFGTIKLITKDEFSKFVDDALCEAKEWKSNQSSHSLVTEGKTNTNGEILLDIELGTKEYIFTCSKEGYTATTQPEIIKVDLSERTLVLTKAEIEEEISLSGLTYSIYPNQDNYLDEIINNQTTIQFNYTDTNKEVTQGCIKFFKKENLEKVVLDEICNDGSSGNIELTYNTNNNFSLTAEVLVKKSNGNTITLESFKYPSNINLKDFLNKYGFDILIPTILVLLSITIGLITKNIYIGIVCINISVWIISGILPSKIPSQIAFVITVMSGIIMWGVYRQK